MNCDQIYLNGCKNDVQLGWLKLDRWAPSEVAQTDVSCIAKQCPT